MTRAPASEDRHVDRLADLEASGLADGPRLDAEDQLLAAVLANR